MKLLARYADPLYALMRIVTGGLFACHGIAKLFGAFGRDAATEPLYVVAGLVELGGGALIALGLLTSWAAFISSGQMAVAYFKAHFPQAFWPIENGGELAAVYCFVFLYIAARGPGPASLDGMWRGGRRKR